MVTEELGALERIERKLDSLHKKVDSLARKRRPKEPPAASRILAHCLTIKVGGPPGPKSP